MLHRIAALGFSAVGFGAVHGERMLQRRADGAHIVFGSEDVLQLRSDGTTPDVITLDYSHLTEGIPTFEVVSSSGDTSVLEITYSDTLAALDLYHGDGPFPLAATMDTYRINRYNTTGATNQVFTNRLIQGGFRYQKLNLSSPGELSLRNVGVKSTVDTTPLTELPGSFECSDEVLNRIWYAGARTGQLTQFPKNTIPLFWELTPEGSLVDSLSPQAAAGVMAPQYRLEFEVKPVRGGFAFLVASDTLNVGAYVTCDISNGFISVHEGSTEVDPVVTSVELPTPVEAGQWHAIAVEFTSTNVTVMIDDVEALSFDPSFASVVGSFGLGASYTHAAVFRNLNATTADGTTLMASTLMDEASLASFYIATNPADTLIDGSKRDRIAYIGDIDIGLGTAFATSWGASFVNGSINLLGSFQAIPGFWIPSAKITQPPYAYGVIPTNLTGLIGHSFNFVTSICRYYQYEGDIAFAETWAPRIVKMLDWAHTQTLDNGLFNVTDPTFGMDWNYYDPPQLGAVTKFNANYAYALQSAIALFRDVGIATASYEAHLAALRRGMNAVLWDDDLAAYAMSDSLDVGFAQDANAIAILGGVPASANRSAIALLDTLQEVLTVSAGPLAFSPGVLAAGWARKISPFASGWHLRAALESHHGPAAMELLKSLWAPMADPQSTNYTDTFWEVLDGEGRPGLPGYTFTSLAHGFSAAPTSELSAHVLGVQPVTPGFKTWKVQPQTLGLQWARGAHPVPRGVIKVDWAFDEAGLLSMKVQTPPGADGMVYLPEPMMVSVDEAGLVLNNRTVNGTAFPVRGGDTFELRQI